MHNIEYLLALHQINGLGPIRLKALLDYFSDPKLAWKAERAELQKIGLPKNVIDLLIDTRKSFDVSGNFEKLQKDKIRYLTIYDEEYPSSLKEIYDPPTVIYYQGKWPDNLAKSVAIVGTRKVTGYGRIVTEKFTQGLASFGLCIVSGLARGVDTIAHCASIEAKGKTVAVLGGGLKNIFPPENTSLARIICEEGYGAVISEYPPDYPSLSGNFPSRNRIISGLSLGVLVTEAAEDSGSLITAKVALEQGREVFAIPGPITSDLSKGTSLLIKQGAKMVTEPEEILEELGLERVKNAELRVKNLENLSDTEKKIFELLKNEGRHVDEVCRELKLSPAQVSATLIKMEITGLVRNLGGGNYIKM